MKKLSLLLFIFSLNAIANNGFHCPELKLTISKVDTTETSTLHIAHQDGTVETNSSLNLPMGSDVDPYQERYAIYHYLIAEAQAHFPYMPETAMVINLMRSQKLYLKGFQNMEGQGEQVKLGKMYCKAMVEAILNFKP